MKQTSASVAPEEEEVSVVITSTKTNSKFMLFMTLMTSMHLTVNIIAIVIVGIWVWACIRTGGFIHWGTDDVILLGSLFGSKALQTKFNNTNGASSLYSRDSRTQRVDPNDIDTDEHGDTVIKLPPPASKPRTKYSSGA